MTRAFEDYQDWSEEFTKARKEVGNIDLLLDLWKAKVPGTWADRLWSGEWGYRKDSKAGAEVAGEKGIEARLLGKPGTLSLLRLNRPGNSYPILTAYHNFPLTNQKKGQVVADVLGVVLAQWRRRPLLVEVKKTDAGPWHALVECLKQVRLARASGARICDHLTKVISPLEPGAWGLVVAPPDYYRKDIKECRKLLQTLKDNTQARIAFATIGSTKTELKWKEGNWE